MNDLSELKGFLPFSLIDWPGKISAVLFFSGCNFACPTCHNWQLAQEGHLLPALAWEEVVSKLKKDQKWLEGVVLTGGEVTLLPYLEELCRELKKLGYLVKVDSNGFKPQVLEKLLALDLVDLLAIDVKGPFEKYSALTGKKVSVEEVKANFTSIFALAQKYPHKFYFRLTKVPLLTEKDMELTRQYLPPNFTLHLQEYINPKGRNKLCQSR